MTSVLTSAFVCLFGFTMLAAQVGGEPPQSPKLGAARGIVLDQAGKPVPGATVFVAGAVTVLRPSALTDDNGEFLLKNISGDLGLLAFKKADGYPFNFAAFFSNPGEQFPSIHAVPGTVTENVVIRLGTKAATLKFAISNDDGQTINNAAATFTRPDMPDIGEYHTRIVSDGKMLVPAVPLRLKVDADGYESWYYGGEEWLTDKGLIVPHSGQVSTVRIQLRKSGDAHGS